MRFREDINGLRAIAVIYVVLFHFGLRPFVGGFVGVDIFFVISGFLMTSLIIDRVDKGRFSVVDFYHARMRRIVPALLLVVMATLIACYFLIDPLIYRDIARHSIPSLLFFSNMMFASETGYLAPAAQENWLLHTWSLSVEWQFYLIYPLWIMLAARFGWMHRAPLLILGVPLLLSVGAAVLASNLGGRSATYAFYWLPTRAWELLAGGLVFVLGRGGRLDFLREQRLLSQSIEIAGIALILSCLFVFDHRTPWPSFYASVPVIGSALIVLADRGSSSLLRNLPLQQIGSSSYSIYLWHWPILQLIRYYAEAIETPEIVSGVALSVVIGMASYRYVEKTTATWISTSRRWISVTGCVVLSLVTATAASAVWRLDGLPGRSKGNVALSRDSVLAIQEFGFPATCGISNGSTFAPCRVGPDVARETVILGDSQAQVLYPRFEDTDASVMFVTNVGCPLFPNVERASRPDCARWRRQAVDFISSHDIGTVIYVGLWQSVLNVDEQASDACLRSGGRCVSIDEPSRIDALFAGLASEVETFQEAGKRVIVVLPLPAPTIDLPHEIAKSEFRGSLPRIQPVMISKAEQIVRSHLDTLAGKGAILLDPRLMMCTGNDICSLIDASGRSLYKDKIHLRPFAVKSMFTLIDPFISPPGSKPPMRP